jgi:hypothetical protein
MKRKACLSTLLLIFGLSILPTTRTHAQIIDAIQAAIKAAIEAADLAVQKAQNAEIDLQNAQKEVENVLSQTELGNIADWTSQFKDLYQNYFNELWQVKTIISEFKGVTDIIAEQEQLANNYKQAYAAIQQDKHFSPSEATYIGNVLSGIISQSAKSLDQITMVLQSFTVQMSDEDRLKIIKGASSQIQQQSTDLLRFNNQNMLISLQRSTNLNDLNSVKQLYGITN